MARPTFTMRPGDGKSTDAFLWKKRAFFTGLAVVVLVLISLMILLADSLSNRFKLISTRGDTDEGFLPDYNVESRVPLLKSVDSSPETTKVIVFAAGKGAGQGLMRAAIKEACKLKGPGMCRPLCDVLDADVFNSLNMDRYMNHRRRMKKVLNSTHQAKPGTLFFGNLYGKCEREFTFPGYPRDHASNPLIHPDLYLTALLAEEVDVDLHIVVLTRRIHVLTEAFLRREGKVDGCVDHRNWEYCGATGATADIRRQKILENGIASLYAQVSLLDPEFVSCLHTSKQYEGVDGLEERLKLPGLQAAIDSRRKTQPFRVMEKQIVENMNPLNSFYASTFDYADQAMMELCRRDAARPSQVLTPNYGLPSVLKKTVFTGPRLVFFAGLEGTGHHLWESIIDKLLKDGKIWADCELNRKLFKSIKGCWAGTENGVFCTRDPQQFKKDYSAAVSKMHKLAAKNNTKAFFLNCVARSKCGSIASYPEYTGNFKAIQRPSVLLLARMAEEAGIDFRIVVLQRRVQNLVYSDTVHRRFNRFEPYLKEERILENNAASLYVELAAIDPRFYSCSDFDDVSLSYTEKLKKTIRVPDIKTVIPQFLNVSLVQSIRELHKDHNLFIKTLGAFTMAIKDLCESSLGHHDQP